MDPGTGLAILGGSALGKEVVGKMLGPTADYVGDGVRNWTERRTENVQRVFRKAHNRLPPGELERPGAVPPRVLKQILDEGQFAEDEVTAEYLGGILASSRTEGTRDDRAASIAATIGRLSTYAIRTHYVLYQAANRLLTGTGIDFRTSAGDTRVFVSTGEYAAAMAFTVEELEDFMGIVSHAFLSLDREDLLGPGWVMGSEDHLRSRVANLEFSGPGLVFRPSQNGIVLFVAGHGIREEPLPRFTDPDADFGFSSVPETPTACLVSSLPTYIPPDDASS